MHRFPDFSGGPWGAGTPKYSVARNDVTSHNGNVRTNGKNEDAVFTTGVCSPQCRIFLFMLADTVQKANH